MVELEGMGYKGWDWRGLSCYWVEQEGLGIEQLGVGGGIDWVVVRGKA